MVLIAIRGVLNVITLSSNIWSCCIYLLPFFWLGNLQFAPFFFVFLDFGICFDSWIKARKNIVFDSNDHKIKQIFFNFIPPMVLIYCCMVWWYDLMLGCRNYDYTSQIQKEREREEQLIVATDTTARVHEVSQWSN